MESNTKVGSSITISKSMNHIYNSDYGRVKTFEAVVSETREIKPKFSNPIINMQKK